MKKSQAAMEFLVTYGWAILVVLVGIGALAYFNIFNPGRFMTCSCGSMAQLDAEKIGGVQYFMCTNSSISISNNTIMHNEVTRLYKCVNQTRVLYDG